MKKATRRSSGGLGSVSKIPLACVGGNSKLPSPIHRSQPNLRVNIFQSCVHVINTSGVLTFAEHIIFGFDHNMKNTYPGAKGYPGEPVNMYFICLVFMTWLQ